MRCWPRCSTPQGRPCAHSSRTRCRGRCASCGASTPGRWHAVRRASSCATRWSPTMRSARRSSSGSSISPRYGRRSTAGTRRPRRSASTTPPVGSDLPLLASALVAARPTGWMYGLGLAAATVDRSRRVQEADAALRSARAAARAGGRGAAPGRRSEDRSRRRDPTARPGAPRGAGISACSRRPVATRALDAAQRQVDEALAEGERLQRAARGGEPARAAHEREAPHDRSRAARGA